MLIVGELINSSRKEIGEAIDNNDADTIVRIAREQKEAGADYIDVNAGTYVDRETEVLTWLIEKVQGAVDTPCCIDSPSPAAIEAALAVHKGVPMINSISLEKDRFEPLLPLVAKAGCKVVALCMSDEGMPTSCDARVAIAKKLVEALTDKGVKLDDIYVDPLVQPLSTSDAYGVEFLEAISAITKAFPGVHTIAGMSNISYGLPARKLINQVFMIMAIARGLDGAIANPLDKRMMAQIVVANSLAGRDEFCGNLLAAYRAKKFEL